MIHSDHVLRFLCGLAIFSLKSACQGSGPNARTRRSCFRSFYIAGMRTISILALGIIVAARSSLSWRLPCLGVFEHLLIRARNVATSARCGRCDAPQVNIGPVETVSEGPLTEGARFLPGESAQGERKPHPRRKAGYFVCLIAAISSLRMRAAIHRR